MNSDQVRGAMWGLLVADAVGVPFEFHRPSELPPVDSIGVELPAGFRRAHPRAPVGAWSDDGALALALADSLAQRGELDLADLASRMVAWSTQGDYAVDGVVYDIGGTTGEALRDAQHGRAPERCGPTGERSNGNGSIMRVLPLALWHRGSDEELVRDAMRQSTVTHGHLRSQLCCAAYVLLARRVAAGAARPWEEASAVLHRIAHMQPAWHAELRDHVLPAQRPTPTGSGYVVDCLYSALWALEADDYRGAVQRAISLGDDTDTTACVAGGIAGLRHGEAGIPPMWMSHLSGKALATPIVQAIAEAAAR